MSFRLYMMLVMTVIGGSFAIWDRVENSVSIQVKVEGVSHRCYGKSESAGMFRKTTRTTDPMDCNHLRQLVATHPDFQDMTIYDQTYVVFHYDSPYDRRHYAGRVMRRTNDSGQALRVNDEITVHVRKFKVGDIRVF